MSFNRRIYALTPILMILALAGCAQAAPAAGGPAPLDQGQALNDSVTAPAGQLLAADVIASWTSLEQAASAGCTASLMGEDTAAVATVFAAGVQEFDRARAAAAESESDNAALGRYPDVAPTVDTSDWCSVTGELAAASK